MLIEFRVKNFRSFKDEAVLKMAASSDKTNEGNSAAKTGHRSVPRLLRSAGIYGANASGKSNLVRAMQLLRGIVNDSASLQAGQEFNIQPFRLDPISETAPTEFEITFLIGGVRYQFGFTVTSKRILSEWLIVHKTTQPAVWYERRLDQDSGKYVYDFSAKLSGAKTVWRDATRDNALFISTAVQLNSDQLRPVFEFLAKGIIVFENGGVLAPDFTVSHIALNQAESVKQFLSAADISIDQIEITKQQGFSAGVKVNMATGVVEAVHHEPREVSIPTFRHKAPTGSAVFDFSDESEGTQKLFVLA